MKGYTAQQLLWLKENCENFSTYKKMGDKFNEIFAEEKKQKKNSPPAPDTEVTPPAPGTVVTPPVPDTVDQQKQNIPILVRLHGDQSQRQMV